MIQASVIGGSGYTGGELMRILLGHDHVELAQVTSERMAGMPVGRAHPNLRGVDLKFSRREEVEPCDILFLCMPHGKSMDSIKEYLKLGKKVVDLSADFRLRAPSDYPKWYGHEHPHPELLSEFIYGLPELHREELRNASCAAGPGCLASAAILALKPILKQGLVDLEHLVIDSKIGSSASGNSPSRSSHHPERAGVIRLYSPTGHRHTAEIEQELTFGGARPKVSFSAHAVEAVRGILSTCHCFLNDDLSLKDIWKVYREDYRGEPFVRIVRERSGLYRLPEPKVLTGTNFCDVGFELDSRNNRLVVVSALDNLVKGAAGSAVQSMNLMLGLKEQEGLSWVNLYPL